MADLTGFGEFRAAIDKHLAELSGALPVLVAAAAVPVEAAIDRRLPRLTGDLEKNLETDISSSPTHAAAVVQIARSAVGEAEEKAVFLEFGTSHAPAEPSFRPGFEESKDKAASILVDGLLKVINK